MYGIVGYVGNRVACPVIAQGLDTLEYRGNNSAGVVLTLVYEKKTIIP